MSESDRRAKRIVLAEIALALEAENDRALDAQRAITQRNLDNRAARKAAKKEEHARREGQAMERILRHNRISLDEIIARGGG